jgi:hypothetical protein
VRPFVVKYLRRAFVNMGQCMITCSTVWMGSPHWHATWSGVCRGKNRWVYSPVKACPVITAESSGPGNPEGPETPYHNNHCMYETGLYQQN